MEELRQISGVLAVFALLGLALWTLRRGGRLSLRSRFATRGKELASVDRLALSPQHALHLVRLGSRELVVATHPQGCTVIREGRAKGAAA